MVVLLAACKREQDKPAPPPPTPAPRPPAQAVPVAPAESTHIPHTTVPMDVDGEWKEVDWSQHASRHQFLGDDGQLARPSSEVRLLHDDKLLYVGLYAGDEDIKSTDAFDVTLGGVALSIATTGKVTPPRDDVKVGVDKDGTVDDPSNNDEEWVIEMAIPMSAVGAAVGKPLAIKAGRCDVTKDGVKRCGSWSGSLVVD